MQVSTGHQRQSRTSFWYTQSRTKTIYTIQEPSVSKSACSENLIFDKSVNRITPVNLRRLVNSFHLQIFSFSVLDVIYRYKNMILYDIINNNTNSKLIMEYLLLNYLGCFHY